MNGTFMINHARLRGDVHHPEARLQEIVIGHLTVFGAIEEFISLKNPNLFFISLDIYNQKHLLRFSIERNPRTRRDCSHPLKVKYIPIIRFVDLQCKGRHKTKLLVMEHVK